MSNGRYTKKLRFFTVLMSFTVIFLFLRYVSFTNNGNYISLFLSLSSLSLFLSLSLSLFLSIFLSLSSVLCGDRIFAQDSLQKKSQLFLMRIWPHVTSFFGDTWIPMKSASLDELKRKIT
jgi:hypothetical protein